MTKSAGFLPDLFVRTPWSPGGARRSCGGARSGAARRRLLFRIGPAPMVILVERRPTFEEPCRVYDSRPFSYTYALLCCILLCCCVAFC